MEDVQATSSEQLDPAEVGSATTPGGDDENPADDPTLVRRFTAQTDFADTQPSSPDSASVPPEPLSAQADENAFEHEFPDDAEGTSTLLGEEQPHSLSPEVSETASRWPGDPESMAEPTSRSWEDTEQARPDVKESQRPGEREPEAGSLGEPEAGSLGEPEAQFHDGIDEAEPTVASSEPQPGTPTGPGPGEAPLPLVSHRPSRLAQLEREGEAAADFLERLLDIADLDGDIDVDIDGDRAAVAVVDSEEGRVPRRLVGSDGRVLEALQELTRLAVETVTGERSRLMLDVAGYRAQRRAMLVDLAKAAIVEVQQSGREKALADMTAFERKVVHDEVTAAGLVSQSEGVEPHRHIVISPR